MIVCYQIASTQCKNKRLGEQIYNAAKTPEIYAQIVLWRLEVLLAQSVAEIIKIIRKYNPYYQKHGHYFRMTMKEEESGDTCRSPDKSLFSYTTLDG